MKKESIHSLIFFFLISFSIGMHTSIYAQTNKTHITLQHQRPVRAMLSGYSDVWTMKSEDRLDGNILATGFFYGGLNGKALGRTFGVNDSSTIAIKPGDQAAIDSRFLVRTPMSDPQAELTMDLAYFAKHGGIMFSWFQHLDGIEEGFYAAFHIPVLVSHHQVKIDILNQVVDENARLSLLDFFAGKEGKRIATNLSEPLQFGKIISGHHVTHGIADIQFLLGYNFLYDSPHHLGFDFSILFPTGTKETAEILFEPVVGSRQYAFSVGLNGYGRMIHGRKHRLCGYFDAHLYFTMKGFEKRIIGIKNLPFGHYYGAAKLEGSSTVDTAFFPATQVLAQEVKINTSSFFEGSLGVSYGYLGYTYDIGYALYYKAKEKISLKDDWSDNMYGIPKAHLLTNQEIHNNTTDLFLPLNKDVLDLDAAATQAQLTHSLYTSLSHTSFDTDYPLTLSIGFLYEYADNPQVVLTGYQLFFKAGVSF